jgi:hypothetical protein
LEVNLLILRDNFQIELLEGGYGGTCASADISADRLYIGIIRRTF